MPYNSEKYTQGTSAFCERHYKIWGIKVYATSSRIVIFDASATSSHLCYICLACMQDIMNMMIAPVTHVGTTFTYDRESMMKNINSSAPKTNVNANHLRDTLSRYEADFRARIKQIRSFEGKYTDRNVVCKEMMDVFKNIFSAVEMYLQKTI